MSGVLDGGTVKAKLIIWVIALVAHLGLAGVIEGQEPGKNRALLTSQAGWRLRRVHWWPHSAAAWLKGLYRGEKYRR